MTIDLTKEDGNNILACIEQAARTGQDFKTVSAFYQIILNKIETSNKESGKENEGNKEE